MDPLKAGFLAIAVLGLLIAAIHIVPALLQLLLSLAPSVLILALIFWILRGMVNTLLK